MSPGYITCNNFNCTTVNYRKVFSNRFFQRYISFKSVPSKLANMCKGCKKSTEIKMKGMKVKNCNYLNCIYDEDAILAFTH